MPALAITLIVVLGMAGTIHGLGTGQRGPAAFFIGAMVVGFILYRPARR